MASVGNGTEESGGGGEEVKGGRLPRGSGRAGSERPSPPARRPGDAGRGSTAPAVPVAHLLHGGGCWAGGRTG